MIRAYAIRLFEEKDLDEVVRINWTNLPENYDNAFFLSLFYHYPKTFVVAEQDGKIVGYMMGRIETGFSCINCNCDIRCDNRRINKQHRWRS